jgi:tetratricopeptide (TPR) repeat protein
LRVLPQLTLVAYIFVFGTILGALCYYGALLALIGAILSFVPGYRHWLERQPGYRSRLSRLWGWKRLARLQLALVTILYLMPVSLLFWYQAILGSRIGGNWFSVDGAIASLFGLIFLYGWSIQNWHARFPGIAITKKFSRKHRDFELSSKQLDQLYRQGKYREGLELATQVVQQARRHFGELHPNYATGLRHLARLHQVLGHYASAKALYQQVRYIRQLTLGEGDLDYVESLSDLAGLYVQLVAT